MSLLATRNMRVILVVAGLLTVVLFLVLLKQSLSVLMPSIKPVAAPDLSGGLAQIPDDIPGTPGAGAGAPVLEKPAQPDAKGPPYPNKQPEVLADKVNQADKLADGSPEKVAEKLQNDGTNDQTKEKVANKDQKEAVPQKLPADAPKKVAGGKDCEKYVIMIDAGLLGLRVHTYQFDTCQLPPKVLKEDFKMLKPGLSSFDTDAEGAARSLDELLDAAVAFVPQAQQKCTPIAVKATAGLRKLGEAKSEAILSAVRKHLENDYPFAVVEGKDGIEVMDGADEGYYAWITTNLLLGTIGGAGDEETAAVFDLGGGLTQIVFQPNKGVDVDDPELKRQFEFGGKSYTLYQYSHLGYGMFEARNKVNARVLKNSNGQVTKHLLKDEAKQALPQGPVVNPCLPPKVKAVEIVEADDGFYKVEFTGGDAHAGGLCRGIVDEILNKDETCNKAPCSFNGVHQPSLVKSFGRYAPMYAFSFFYDRTNPLGFPADFKLDDIGDLARAVCLGSELAAVFSKVASDKLAEEPFWCADLLIIYGLLHTGYDIPLNREIRTASTIQNFEIGWCLGALLPLLESEGKNWRCRA